MEIDNTGNSTFPDDPSSFLERYANGEFLDWSPNNPIPTFADKPSFTYLKPPEPRNERERLQRVCSNDPASSPSIESLAKKTCAKLAIIADLAKSTFQVDTVVISLIDDRFLRIKASLDFLADTPLRVESLCAHVLLRNGTEPIIVHDTKKDWRFVNHPMVTRAGGYRFWSGAPLRTEDGYNIGAFSLYSRSPCTHFGLSEAQKQVYMALICIHEFEYYQESRMLLQHGRWQNAISDFSQRSTLCKSSSEICQLAAKAIANGLEVEIVFIVEIYQAAEKLPFYLQSSVGLDVLQIADDEVLLESSGKEVGPSNKKATMSGASLLHALSIAHSRQGHTVRISGDEFDMIPKPANITALFGEDDMIKCSAGSGSFDDTSTSSSDVPSTPSVDFGIATFIEKSGFAIGAYTNEMTTIVDKKHLQFLLDFGIAFWAALELHRTQTILRLSEKDLKREKEKDRFDSLILNILPLAFSDKLMEGTRAIAETYPFCTIIFADIVNFTRLCRTLSTNEIVLMLDRLFCRFDLIAAYLGIEKVKTVGDTYMAGSGFPLPRDDHVQVVAEFALAILATVRDYNRVCVMQVISQIERMNLMSFLFFMMWRHSQTYGKNIQFRIGFNSGPLMAGVIGQTKFVYDIWGNTVNLAKRFESASKPDHINVDQVSYELLKDLYCFENRGAVAVKGVGDCTMYFLKGRIYESEKHVGRLPEEVLAEMFRDTDAVGISGISNTLKPVLETSKKWKWGGTPTVSRSVSPDPPPLPFVPKDLGHAEPI